MRKLTREDSLVSGKLARIVASNEHIAQLTGTAQLVEHVARVHAQLTTKDDVTRASLVVVVEETACEGCFKGKVNHRVVCLLAV